MSQHFLLSSRAKTLSLGAVLRMTDEEAEQTFMGLRWHETGASRSARTASARSSMSAAGRPARSGSAARRAARISRSRSGTLFAFHKMSLRNYLAATAIFINEVKGKSALALSRDLGTAYMTAFVLSHKLREAMASELKGMTLGGARRNGRDRWWIFRRLREAGQPQREPPRSSAGQEPERQAPGCGDRPRARWPVPACGVQGGERRAGMDQQPAWRAIRA